jgi:AraC-like DNA-binding protein
VQYLTDKRILRAKRLLGEDIPLSEIAERTGFQDYSHFYKCFMKCEGMKPSEFRRQMQDDR